MQLKLPMVNDYPNPQERWRHASYAYMYVSRTHVNEDYVRPDFALLLSLLMVDIFFCGWQCQYTTFKLLRCSQSVASDLPATFAASPKRSKRTQTK
jgi:hypothetical protein